MVAASFGWCLRGLWSCGASPCRARVRLLSLPLLRVFSGIVAWCCGGSPVASICAASVLRFVGVAVVLRTFRRRVPLPRHACMLAALGGFFSFAPPALLALCGGGSCFGFLSVCAALLGLPVVFRVLFGLRPLSPLCGCLAVGAGRWIKMFNIRCWGGPLRVLFFLTKTPPRR